MEQLTFTPSTIILLLLIVACVFLAIYRLTKKGMCDCNDNCDCSGCSKKTAKGGTQTCSCCKATKDMVKQLERL